MLTFHKRNEPSMARVLDPLLLQGGYTISRPGSYALAASVAFVGRKGLVIAASGVHLDLKGYALDGSTLTEALIKVEPGKANVRIQDGSLSGGERSLYVGAKASGVELLNLHAYGFSFAGFELHASQAISLTSCSVGRASRAPYGSVFGILALPAGGFAQAKRIMAGGDVPSTKAAAARGGKNIQFLRCSVGDVTPLLSEECRQVLSSTAATIPNCDYSSCFEDSRRAVHKRSVQWHAQKAAAPHITDAGGVRVNSSGCRVVVTGVMPTQDLRRRSEILGSSYGGSQSDADVGPAFGVVQGAGVHALTLFNWTQVRGIPAEVAVTFPSPLPLCDQSVEPLSAWGARSGILIKNSLDDPRSQLVDLEDLSQVPLGIMNVRVQQAARPYGGWLPGAAGSYIAR